MYVNNDHLPNLGSSQCIGGRGFGAHVGKDMIVTTDNSNQQAELYGPPPESEFYGYYRKDWIDLCEDIKGNDRTVYGVLRSLVFEDRRRNIHNNVRILSLDDMCALIPGAGGKPITLGGLRDSLRRLTAVGLVSDPDNKPLTTSSTKKAAEKPLKIRIHDVPFNDYVPTWRNTEDKLRAIQAGWKSNQPELPESSGWESNQPGWESNQPGWESNPDLADDQVKRDLYTSSFTPSLSTSSPAPSSTSANEGVAQEGGEEVESPEKSKTRDTAASIAHRLPGKMNRVQRQKVTVAIARLLVAGWGGQALEQELTADLTGVRSHYAVYQKRLEEYAELEPVGDDASTSTQGSAADDCAQCDQNGWITVDNGTPNGAVVRCAHDGSTPAAAEPKSVNGNAVEARAAFAELVRGLGAA
jgi:hypothetical protein